MYLLYNKNYYKYVCLKKLKMKILIVMSSFVCYEIYNYNFNKMKFREQKEMVCNTFFNIRDLNISKAFSSKAFEVVECLSSLTVDNLVLYQHYFYI